MPKTRPANHAEIYGRATPRTLPPRTNVQNVRGKARLVEQFAIFCTLSERVAASVVFACCAYVSDFVAACSNY